MTTLLTADRMADRRMWGCGCHFTAAVSTWRVHAPFGMFDRLLMAAAWHDAFKASYYCVAFPNMCELVKTFCTIEHVNHSQQLENVVRAICPLLSIVKIAK